LPVPPRITKVPERLATPKDTADEQNVTFEQGTVAALILLALAEKAVAFAMVEALAEGTPALA